jgi:hypothetical protein
MGNTYHESSDIIHVYSLNSTGNLSKRTSIIKEKHLLSLWYEAFAALHIQTPQTEHFRPHIVLTTQLPHLLAWQRLTPQINKSTDGKIRGNMQVQRHIRNLTALLVAGMPHCLQVKYAPGVNIWNYVAWLRQSPPNPTCSRSLGTKKNCIVWNYYKSTKYAC